jgi:hypothetical protein
LRYRTTFAAIVLTLALASPAFAGGGGFGGDDDDADSGPPYFGLVKDNGGKDIADAKITVTITKMNSTLVQRSDTMGHFFIRGFDKTVDPKDVVVVCSKDGYAQATAEATPAIGNAPIQLLCVLQKS